MNEIFNEIQLGAERPFEILHISDTHLTLADDRDDKRKNKLAKHRAKSFPNANDCIRKAAALSNSENKPLLCTGDLIDFVSQANLEAVSEYTAKTDIFACAGNHEFSLYVGEAWEDEDYRNISLGAVQRSYTNDIRFASRTINGVNFVAIDNGYYLFDRFQLDKLKNEAAKGLPVVLMLHVPLYTEELYRYIMETLGREDAAIMSVPEEKLKGYSDYRYRQQKENDITREAFDYIINEPAIKLILSGHLHFDFETRIDGRLPQLITGTETLRRVKFL